MFRRSCLPLLFVLAALGAACSGDTISFDGERAVDAAATPIPAANVEAEAIEPEPAVTEAPTAEAPTPVPVEPTATPEAVETAPVEETPAVPEPVGFDQATVDEALQLLETPGGMVYVADERQCMSAALLGSDFGDPSTDTEVLNCLDDDGVHRWVSAQLGAIGRSERSIVDRGETACVWEQSGGQIFGINAASSPALQRCGVWGRVNLGGIDAFSDELLTCLDVQMQTTRLPDGTDRAALDDRISQCASPDELAFWNTL